MKGTIKNKMNRMKTIVKTGNTTHSESQGIIADNMIFISGQIGKDPKSGLLISSDIEDETKQLIENIKSILSEVKIDFSNIVKSSIYLTKIKDLDSVNKVYASYFASDFPACEIIEASALQQNAHIEISMVATVN